MCNNLYQEPKNKFWIYLFPTCWLNTGFRVGSKPSTDSSGSSCRTPRLPRWPGDGRSSSPSQKLLRFLCSFDENRLKNKDDEKDEKKIEKSNQDNILWLISIILAKTICDSKKFLFKDWKNGNQDNNFWLISIFFYCWLNVTICDSKKYLFKDWNMVI